MGKRRRPSTRLGWAVQVGRVRMLAWGGRTTRAASFTQQAHPPSTLVSHTRPQFFPSTTAASASGGSSSTTG
ncbi:hypothetical protein [Actinomadura sp. NAK00032]|uniref:hypothetical protein n=1 Tax=Actinomadura sp. NAK00032 TaxID=2742128 RepID=UPI0034A54A2F